MPDVGHGKVAAGACNACCACYALDPSESAAVCPLAAAGPCMATSIQRSEKSTGCADMAK